jgi:tetratricopeptide (TPR) repeat protein
VAGAVREFEEEARVAPNSMPAYLGLGQLAADAGQDELAITHYRRAVRLAPRNASAHQALADGYEQGGRLREAAAERRRVVLLEPGSPVRRYELARTYRAQARQPGAPKERLLRAAVSELRIAFRLSPNPEIAYALGAVLLAGDQPREAIREFKRGIELDAAWPDSYRGLARAYEALDDRDAAIQAWRDFLTHRPDEDAAAQARARLRALESP